MLASPAFRQGRPHQLRARADPSGGLRAAARRAARPAGTGAARASVQRQRAGAARHGGAATARSAGGPARRRHRTLRAPHRLAGPADRSRSAALPRVGRRHRARIRRHAAPHCGRRAAGRDRARGPRQHHRHGQRAEPATAGPAGRRGAPHQQRIEHRHAVGHRGQVLSRHARLRPRDGLQIRPRRPRQDHCRGAATRGSNSLLGHHYPATDIPQRARELYLRTRLRVLADVHYEASPLRAATPAGARR